MADYIATDTEFTAVANAIRTKGGTQADLEWPSGFVTAIGNISGGGGTDTSDATLTSGAQMLSGYTAYSKGTKYTGSIAAKTASDLEASGATVTVPSGYYASNASKSVSSGSATAPATISGTSATPSGSSTTLTLSKTVSVTPTVSAGYVSSGTAGNSSVSLSATDSNWVASNIKNGVSIFGKTGSYTGTTPSGTISIANNGTYDVTNYASASVNVSGGSGMIVATATKTLTSASTSISFSVSGEPTSFVVMSSANQTTGGTKALAVVYDGTNVLGQTLTSQVTYDGSNFSKSYSSGTLTVTGTASFQANEYTLVYTYGGSSANIGTADVQVGSGATSITFTGLTDEPDYFSCIFKSDFGTSSGYQRVIAVAYDGTDTYGLAMDSGAKAQTSWSYTYNNGSLTISSTGTNNGGYFHQPGYYQLTYGYGGEPPQITTESLSVTANGTYTAPSGKAYTPVVVSVSGGSASVDTKTLTNDDNTATSIQFTSMKGTPKYWFLRTTSQISSSGSTSYYYVVDMRYNGTNTTGNVFRIGSTRRVDNVTSGYSFSYSGTTLTISSSGSRTASPGSFYNGTYELVYIY